MTRCPRRPTGLHEWRPGPAVMLKEGTTDNGERLIEVIALALVCECGAIAVRDMPDLGKAEFEVAPL